MKLYLVEDCEGGEHYIVKAGNSGKAERLLGDSANVICEASAYQVYEFDLANHRHNLGVENRVIPSRLLDNTTSFAKL